MQIQRVDLVKWCQLDGTFEFGPGLNSIRGPNGAGKTNLVNSIVFALTGDLSRLHGVKSANVNFFAEKKDKSSVCVAFSHEDVQGEMTRILQPTPKQELVLTSKGHLRKYTRDSEVTDQLERLLGINQKMLLDYVFVQQWGIFKFIDQQPAVRARALAELFGADRAERIYKDLGDIEIEIPSPAIDADIVRARIGQNKKELEELETKLKMFLGLPEKLEDAISDSRDIVRKYERRTMLLDKKSNLIGNKKARIDRAEALQFEIEPLTAKRDEMKAKIDNGISGVAAAKQGLADWQAYDANESRRAAASKDYAQTVIAIQDLALDKPNLPDCYVDGEARKSVESSLSEIKHNIKRYGDILTKVAKLGKMDCPTCGTPVNEMSEHLDKYSKYVLENTPLVVETEKILEASDQYNTKKREVDDEQLRLTSRLTALKKQLDSLEDNAKPAMCRATCQEIINQHELLSREFNQLCDTLRIGEGKVNDMLSQAKSFDDMIVTYEAELAALGDIGATDADSAARFIDEKTNEYVERDTLRSRKRDIERLIKDDETALEKCKVEQHRADRLRLTEAHLEEVREVYRKLITIVPQHNMEELRAEVNDNLNRFGTKFRVEAIDDLRFLLRYHSGRVQPAERLSGGERVMLALAFRIAVNSRYAKELGLLCLDEPTAGLDEDNLGCLEIAIGRLRELSQARGLQAIIVTHDPGLDGLFDRVIQLRAAS